MREFAANDKADYYSRITSIMVNGKNAYELKGKFPDDLHNNAFNGTNKEDAVEHIEYFLKIVDPIDLPNVNQDKLRVVVFPISFAGDAWRWIETNMFDYETPLCEKFKEFNYLLKIDLDLLTKDIEGFKTYDEYKDDWIYEWNENMPWDQCELFDDHELPVCNVRRFKMIKYSFRDDEEYVVVKEDEYDDLTSTSKDACRAYQEIFCMMDEGWMNLAEIKETDNVGEESKIWRI
nr:hypothetical protein [Tanacetum cinerariifolium]